MTPSIDLNSARAREARLGRTIGKTGFQSFTACAALSLVLVTVLIAKDEARFACFAGALALLFALPAIWWKRQLSVLPASKKSGADLTGQLSGDVLARLKPGMLLSPQSVWSALNDHWQAIFFINHLLIPKELIYTYLSSSEADLGPAMQVAEQISQQSKTPTIELGFVVAGLLATSPAMQQLMVQMKNQPQDIEAIGYWLGRNLRPELESKRTFGGVGRDWAFGFTPLLDRLGHNLSLGIAKFKIRFDSLTESEGVLAIEKAFDNHASAVVLVGPDGIGKTNSVYALAQKLIEGSTTKSLAYHQVISLNATDITSQARGPGELEHIMVSLYNEAAAAGHVVLFFDDAQLFLGGAPGSFDATQILLSIIHSRAVPIILAMTGPDYQRLKVQNQSLASLLSVVTLQEMSESGVMQVLEDSALGLESRFHVLVAYEALGEAYRLSGRYNQEEAYPGKAIKLLEQAINHPEHGVITRGSVQKAIEQTHGVKVSSAQPAEADTLLHLEDAIHQRMINQNHAVKVVASALRRARAGVTNPRRPIGSFLFLGPTGVGKTELARSIAAVYFGAERAMIRLDMSEYQQESDVQRLLSTGASEASSLLMNIRQQPFSVVLLDEIEKAHPNILNLLLQLLDEGQLTDVAGRPASFKDAVIIATSNAGANSIRERVARGESLESFAASFNDELIASGQFKPELLNRFDDIVLFRPLSADELSQVVRLQLNEVNQTLANQNIQVSLTEAAIAKVVQAGNDPRLGARPMRRVLQRTVEEVIAQKILRNEAHPGDKIVLDAPDLEL